MSLFARAKKARENKKGFTLVELIVVLVILAILAAILVPALLGWIDEAKKKQYVLDARNIYMACQAVADEGFAADVLTATSTSYTDLTDYLQHNYARIGELSDIVTDGSVGTFVVNNATPMGDSGRNLYKIKKMQITFPCSKDGTVVYATLEGDNWEVKDEAPVPQYKTS